MLFNQRKYAIICTKSQTIMRKYVHLRQSAFNCAKCTLHKDICIIVNIQLSFKSFIYVLRNSNSSKLLSHYCLTFSANDCVFSLNKQQKVYYYFIKKKETKNMNYNKIGIYIYNNNNNNNNQSNN